MLSKIDSACLPKIMFGISNLDCFGSGIGKALY
jgi:hypothetical protein